MICGINRIKRVPFLLDPPASRKRRMSRASIPLFYIDTFLFKTPRAKIQTAGLMSLSDTFYKVNIERLGQDRDATSVRELNLEEINAKKETQSRKNKEGNTKKSRVVAVWSLKNNRKRRKKSRRSVIFVVSRLIALARFPFPSFSLVSGLHLHERIKKWVSSGHYCSARRQKQLVLLGWRRGRGRRIRGGAGGRERGDRGRSRSAP
ncbi:hypothetical protein BC939DRAFT_445939, partial [Gamsiella multidivaricata]|uniref:uncharacterized protein n=1 Tax=Gamsiella multidivaricata TaxID=101098 RepID=UPI002220E84A